MIFGRSGDVEGSVIRSIEGHPVEGHLLIKVLLQAEEMTVLEVHAAAGTRSPLHAHGHESVVYVVSGGLRMTVGSEARDLGPGDVAVNPRDVPHGIESLEDTVFVEIKSPATDLSFLKSS